MSRSNVAFIMCIGNFNCLPRFTLSCLFGVRNELVCVNKWDFSPVLGKRTVLKPPRVSDRVCLFKLWVWFGINAERSLLLYTERKKTFHPCFLSECLLSLVRCQKQINGFFTSAKEMDWHIQGLFTPKRDAFQMLHNTYVVDSC